MIEPDAYRGILERIGHRNKSCGFICGREDMALWNPLEVCQLTHTTRDLCHVRLPCDRETGLTGLTEVAQTRME